MAQAWVQFDFLEGGHDSRNHLVAQRVQLFRPVQGQHRHRTAVFAEHSVLGRIVDLVRHLCLHRRGAPLNRLPRLPFAPQGPPWRNSAMAAKGTLSPGVIPRPSSCPTDRGQKAEYHSQKDLNGYPVRRWGTRRAKPIQRTQSLSELSASAEIEADCLTIVLIIR
jgi:hypothetical protein